MGPGLPKSKASAKSPETAVHVRVFSRAASGKITRTIRARYSPRNLLVFLLGPVNRLAICFSRFLLHVCLWISCVVIGVVTRHIDSRNRGNPVFTKKFSGAPVLWMLRYNLLRELSDLGIVQSGEVSLVDELDLAPVL